MTIKYIGHPDQLHPFTKLEIIDEHPPIISKQLKDLIMHNRNINNHSHSQSHSHQNGVRSAGFQNKQPNFYKQGVRYIYGIPYTVEEQTTRISWDQIKNTIIMLCREQRRNPNFSGFDWASQTGPQSGMYLPFANEIVSNSIAISERI